MEERYLIRKELLFSWFELWYSWEFVALGLILVKVFHVAFFFFLEEGGWFYFLLIRVSGGMISWMEIYLYSLILHVKGKKITLYQIDFFIFWQNNNYFKCFLCVLMRACDVTVRKGIQFGAKKTIFPETCKWSPGERDFIVDNAKT